MSESPKAIEAVSLEFSYDTKKAVCDVSFEVARGEFVAVLGPNGSGKSTLLKCVGKILQGWRGEVRIDGRDASKMRQREIAMALGYVPQTAKACLPFTVREFAMLGRHPHLAALEMPGPEDLKAVDDAFDAVGVKHLAARRMDALSGGERQMALIAAAMAQGAKTLLLDEPGSFLDCKRVVALNAMLRHMNKDLGLSVLCVTHDVNQALSLGDKVLALKDGSPVFFGTPKAALESDVLDKLYGVGFERLDRGPGRLPWLVPQENEA